MYNDDLYTPHSLLVERVYKILDTYEQYVFPAMQRTAVQSAYRLVVLEDKNTDCQDLEEANKTMNPNTCARLADGCESAAYKHHHQCRHEIMSFAAHERLATVEHRIHRAAAH